MGIALSLILVAPPALAAPAEDPKWIPSDRIDYAPLKAALNNNRFNTVWANHFVCYEFTTAMNVSKSWIDGVYNYRYLLEGCNKVQKKDASELKAECGAMGLYCDPRDKFTLDLTTLDDTGENYEVTKIVNCP